MNTRWPIRSGHYFMTVSTRSDISQTVKTCWHQKLPRITCWGYGRLLTAYSEFLQFCMKIPIVAIASAIYLLICNNMWYPDVSHNVSVKKKTDLKTLKITETVSKGVTSVVICSNYTTKLWLAWQPRLIWNIQSPYISWWLKKIRDEKKYFKLLYSFVKCFSRKSIVIP